MSSALPRDSATSSPVSFVPQVSAMRSTRALPRPPTSLIGREDELAAVAGLFQAGRRLVTLIGPGGVGKTHLALTVGHELVGDFADGAVFVDLAALRDPAQVLPTIARALDVREGAGESLTSGVEQTLGDRHLLLILDNLEQVVDAASDIAELLAVCPHLAILATSRIPLRLRIEQIYPVAPLAVPGGIEERQGADPDWAASPAVALFVQRARAVRPGFVVTETNAPLIAGICRRLDGLPLAIELAAAQSRSLSPAALLVRLSNRLRVLVDGPRDLPPRLRTMRDAICWSHDLLPPQTQKVFRDLAVFEGGFTLEAAEAVCGASESRDAGAENERILSLLPAPAPDVDEMVRLLVEASLLRAEGLDDASGPRYRMLETVREFALEHLTASGEEIVLQRRHAAWCLALAERTEPGLWGTEQTLLLDCLEGEHDNLRAALAFLEREEDWGSLLDLAAALSWFWFVHGHVREGRSWLSRALAHGQRASSARARALVGAGRLAHYQGDAPATMPLVEESLAISRTLGDTRGVANAMYLLGIVAEDAGDYATAAERFETTLALFHEMGADTVDLARTRAHLGLVAWGTGDSDGAVTHLEESLRLHRDARDSWGTSLSLGLLGLLACTRRDHERAAALHRESLTLWIQLGGKGDVTGHLANFATLAAWCGQPATAARLFGAAEAIREAFGGVLRQPEWGVYEAAAAKAHRELGEAGFTAAWAEGQALPLTDALREAMEVSPDRAAPSATADVTSAVASLQLTSREAEVLRVLALGHSNQHIADALFISQRTVQAHLRNIFAKLGVSSRAEAIAFAHQHGAA